MFICSFLYTNGIFLANSSFKLCNVNLTAKDYNKINGCRLSLADEDITSLGQGEETDIDCEEPELDSIEKIKADLPKNIVKNMDDLTFIQPVVNSM